MTMRKQNLTWILCALAWSVTPCCTQDDDADEKDTQTFGDTDGATDEDQGTEAADTGGTDHEGDTDTADTLSSTDTTDTGTEEEDTDSYAAFVVTTDYATGTYSVVDPAARTAQKDIEVIHQDAGCRYDPVTQTTFVVARFGSDAIQIIDDSDWSVADEYSVGAGSNPQTIAVVSPERAYVPRLASAELLVVNPLTGEELGTINLADEADSDGIAEQTGAVVRGGKVYVPLARLTNYMPSEFSSIVVIDGPTGAIEATVELTGTNPTDVRYNGRLGRIVLVETGSYGVQDGGVELFDPKTQEVSGFIVTEAQLGGDVLDVYLHSDALGYALVGVPAGDASYTHMVTFNPATGEVIEDILTPSAWVLQSFEPTPNGKELWVADRTPEAPGIRVFDTATGEELTDKPIDVGLPPAAVCFTAG